MNNGDPANTSSRYPWAILIILTSAMFVVNVAQFQVAGLASQLIPAMNLQLNQFAMALSVPMLTCVFMGIPGGLLADRFGVKPVIAVGLIIATIGCFGRLSATNFSSLFSWMFLIGFALAVMNGNGVKLLSAWFPPAKVGTVMGIFIGGASLGLSVANATSPFFPSIRSAFMTIAIIALVISLLWIIFVKEKPQGAPVLPPMSIADSFTVSFKSKNTWLAGFSMMFWMGSWVAYTGNLPNALIQVKGVTPVIAGLVASTLGLSFIAGSMIGPALSDKYAVLKPFFTPLAILSGIFAYAAWTVNFGPLVWVLSILSGFILGMYMPLIMSLPVLLPEIGMTYAGGASGIISTLQMAGGFLIPSYVIPALVGTHVENVFSYCALGFVITGVFLFFIPDVKAKAKSKQTLNI